MDARSLIETLKIRGIRISLAGNKVRIEAPQEPDSETKAIIEALRDHREEVKSILRTPACYECGELMTGTKDIFEKEWWACWRCARSA